MPKSEHLMELPMKEIMKEITVNVDVSGVNAAVWRIRCGCILLKLAAQIIGCGIKIN